MMNTSDTERSDSYLLEMLIIHLLKNTVSGGIVWYAISLVNNNKKLSPFLTCTSSLHHMQSIILIQHHLSPTRIA
jgi:hypothetical protein